MEKASFNIYDTYVGFGKKKDLEDGKKSMAADNGGS